MKDFITQELKNENAVLVGLITQDQNEDKVNEYLDELAFLAETAGLRPIKRFLQKNLETHMARMIIKEKLKDRDRVVVGVDRDNLNIQVKN